MNENLNNQIVALYNDPLFQELKAYYSKTTIFNILKIERNENRHSAFLAWLLDANGSHGLKEEPLRKFLRALAVSETGSIDKTLANSFVSGNYSYENLVVETEKSVETEKKGRIDVFVSFDMETANKETANKGNANNKTHVYIIIENKVYSKEHDEQTKIYLDWASRELRKRGKKTAIIGVFLSPEKQSECSAVEFVKFTYEDLLEKVIEPLLCMEMTDKNRWILNDYILNLGQPAKSWNDKEDPEKEDRILAVSSAKRKDFRRLYRKHRVLFDTILICANVVQNNNQYNDQIISVFGDKKCEEVCKLDVTSKDLLLGVWNNKGNQQLIKMTFNNWVEDNCNETEVEVWKTLLGLKSNRFNFIFNGECYKTKAELCHAIVESYIDKHPKVPEVTIEELRTTFRISNNFNTVETYGEAMMTEDSAKNPGGNYYISKPIPITINGCEDKVVVWRYWPEKYFNPFMEEVKKLGYEIK